MVFGYLSAIVILAQIAEPTYRPAPPSNRDIACEATGPMEAKAWDICPEDPTGTQGCHEFINDLSAVQNPSLDQRMALYVAHSMRNDQEPDHAKRNALKRRSMARLRSLLDDYPNNPKVLYVLASREDDAESIPLLRRVLELEPTCTAAARDLAETTIRLADEESTKVLQEAYTYMFHAYTHSADHRKLFFANRLMLYYLDETLEGHHQFYEHGHRLEEIKKNFRTQVIADMKLESLPLNEAHRTESLNLLCSEYALEIGIEGLCIDAMAHVAQRDAREGRPIGEDILHNIGQMARRIRANPWPMHDVVAFGIAPIEGYLGEWANHVIFMRDLLDEEPEERRTALFYETYASLVTREREVDMYRKALALDPTNGRLGIKVADMLRDMKRYDEARGAYQDVILHSEGHPHNYTRFKTWADRAAYSLRRMEDERLNDPER